MEDELEAALDNVPPLNVPFSWTDLFQAVAADEWWPAGKTIMMLQTSKALAAWITRMKLPARIKVRSLDCHPVASLWNVSILLGRLNIIILERQRLNTHLALNKLLAFAGLWKAKVVALDLSGLYLHLPQYDVMCAVLRGCWWVEPKSRLRDVGELNRNRDFFLVITGKKS